MPQIVYARNRVCNGVTSAFNVYSTNVEIVGCREPKKVTQFIHDHLIGCCPFVENLHSCLVFAVDNNPVIGSLGGPMPSIRLKKACFPSFLASESFFPWSFLRLTISLGRSADILSPYRRKQAIITFLVFLTCLQVLSH